MAREVYSGGTGSVKPTKGARRTPSLPLTPTLPLLLPVLDHLLTPRQFYLIAMGTSSTEWPFGRVPGSEVGRGSFLGGRWRVQGGMVGGFSGGDVEAGCLCGCWGGFIVLSGAHSSDDELDVGSPRGFRWAHGPGCLQDVSVQAGSDCLSGGAFVFLA